jgi:hypothetical protein
MKPLYLFFLLGLFLLIQSCSPKVLYNSYLVSHKKYNMTQVFNYPSNVNFWSVQDSSKYQIIDTLKYKVKYKNLHE